MKNKQHLLKSLASPSFMGFLAFSGLLQADLMAGGTQQVPSKTLEESSSVQTHPNAKIITTPDGSTVQIESDGTKIIKTPDNTSIEVKPDGTKLIKNADGSLIEKKVDGTKIIKKPDGTVIQVKPDGAKTIKNADGSTVEVKPGS